MFISENKPALFIFYLFFKSQNTLTFQLSKTIENRGKSHYEINIFLKYTFDTIIGTPRNSYG